MEKVFVVTSTFSDSNTHEVDFRVDGVFRNEKDAQSYVSSSEHFFCRSYEILETEIVEKWK